MRGVRGMGKGEAESPGSVRDASSEGPALPERRAVRDLPDVSVRKIIIRIVDTGRRT